MAWPISVQAQEALRGPATIVSTAVHRNPFTGVKTPLMINDGAVTVDATTAYRRSLSLSTDPKQSVYDVLSVPGAEITVTQTLIYTDSSRESVPQGVFIVDQSQIGYAPGDTLQLTCPDRSLKIARNRFGVARSSIASNKAWQEIQRLVEGAWPGSTYPFPGWSLLDESATSKVGSILWDDGQRDAAITSLCTASSVEMFFDQQGKAVLRPVPLLSSSSVPAWTVDANAPGAIMTAADRSWDMSSVRNAVLASTSATDVTFAPQLWQNTTVGDPLNVTGPLGFVPYYYSSPLLRTAAQALAAAKTILRKQLGVARQLTVEAANNPALDAGDVIKVMLPKIDRNTARPIELHIIDSVTHPLTPQGTQQITTRSTRPDADDS